MNNLFPNSVDVRMAQLDTGWSAFLVLPPSENKNMSALPVFKLRMGNQAAVQRGLDDYLPAPLSTSVKRLVAMWMTPALRTVKAEWRLLTNEGRAMANSFLSQSMSYLAALPEGCSAVDIASAPSQSPVSVFSRTSPMAKSSQVPQAPGLRHIDTSRRVQPDRSQPWNL